MTENFKVEFLLKLKELNALELPKDKYVITGSGPLAIRNVRKASDVDVLVNKALWDQLLSKFSSFDGLRIVIGNLEIWKDFLNLTDRIEEVIQNREIIEGYPFMNLEDTLSWKTFRNSEKDQKDIALIREILKP